VPALARKSDVPESAIQTWLAIKQRKALLSARLYFTMTLLGGIFVLLPNLAILYIVDRILLWVIAPSAHYPELLALLPGVPLVWLLVADSIRAERDDMAVIPLWLAREYFHAGPRLIRDGRQSLARARQFSRIDVESCAKILAALVSRTTPTAREELTRVFPGLVWEEIIPQLRLIDGVIVFRGATSVSLLAPLRLELRQLLAHIPNAEIPREEPEGVPVEEPQQLTPREILGVSATASAAEIKTAYRNRVKECHPDRFPNLDESSRKLAEEWTKALNAAYAELLRKPAMNKR
jgi:DnaJ domain